MVLIITGLRCSFAAEIYQKSIEKTDKWAKYFYFVFTKITFPGTVLPPLIMSYFAYFKTESGSSAFELPFLVWY